jgi:hypothetical protein
MVASLLCRRHLFARRSVDIGFVALFSSLVQELVDDDGPLLLLCKADIALTLENVCF